MSEKNWYKVDNVAKVFLATAGDRDTRTLRVSCSLWEMIDPEILQMALDQAIIIRPQFQVRIRRGFFWHYMEETDIRPKVVEESGRVCPKLYSPGTDDLHYRVSYFVNRINLDLFHALSDGTGALEFLNVLVLEYFKLKYPERYDELKVHSGASFDDLTEDSYKQFYEKSGKAGKIHKKSYHPSGLKLPYNQLQFFEIHMPTAEILPKAKELGVSLTSYIGARFMLAMYKDMPALKRKKIPITISLPVNLRNYYPSNTSRNFFNSVMVTHLFTEEISLEELAKDFDAQLKENLTPEKIKAQMDNFEMMESVAPIKIVPLFIKQFTVRFFSKRSDKNVSMVLSNLGVQKPAPEISPMINNFGAFCSSSNLFSTVMSYNGDLTLGVSSPYSSTGVLKNFVRSLTDEDIKVSAFATEVVR